MPKFAVYFVPKSDLSFYEFGSQILGYDLRARRSVQMSAGLEQELGQIEGAWVQDARPYGFHVTICDALDCDFVTIPAVESRLLELLRCFGPGTEFKLSRRNEQPVAIWGNAGAHPIVLRYNPNIEFAMLHALLVGCINPLGRGTGYLRDYLTGTRAFDKSKGQKIRVFSSHTILDYWAPHFTLLNPYSGPAAEALASAFGRLSKEYQELIVDSVCLLIQEHDEANWFIYREFVLDEIELSSNSA
jgi:hypothetical protein